MLINTKQLCAYLRSNAETLRAGGSEASAEIYDEIAAGIEGQEKDFADEQEKELEEAQRSARDILSEYQQELMEKCELMVVPSGWRNVT